MESVLTWYQSGGPFMAPLLIVGVVGLLLLVERVMHNVLRSRIVSRPFMERVISLTRAGHVDDALSLCAEHHAILPDLGLVLLRSRSADEAELRAIADASEATVLPSMTRRLRWMPVLSQLSLLIGVLGAIVNLHDGLAGGAVDGVRFALRPLAAGVGAAIPLVAGHTYLQGQVRTILEQMDEFSARLINALLDRQDVRLGHRD